MDEIRIVSPAKTSGYLYLVCKKRLSRTCVPASADTHQAMLHIVGSAAVSPAA